MKKVGIYSGVFDPVHHGHISFARKAAQELGLDKVFFMPEPTPQHKVDASDLRHRLNMIWLAIKDSPELDLIHHDHQQFTVRDTLPWLEEKFQNAELHLLMGIDAFKSLPTWRDFDELKHRVQFVVGNRQGHAGEGLEIIPHQAIETAMSDVSSTQVRSLGADVRGSYVPDDVARYIDTQNLYR